MSVHFNKHISLTLYVLCKPPVTHPPSQPTNQPPASRLQPATIDQRLVCRRFGPFQEPQPVFIILPIAQIASLDSDAVLRVIVKGHRLAATKALHSCLPVQADALGGCAAAVASLQLVARHSIAYLCCREKESMSQSAPLPSHTKAWIVAQGGRFWPLFHRCTGTGT